MYQLITMLKEDMKPALGVTEPGAIAFSVAKAKSFTMGEIKHVCVKMNSGMYKNAFTCGIPHSHHLGAVSAAALGAVAGKPEKGLEALADVTPEDDKQAELLVEAKKIEICMTEITSIIYLEATVKTENDICTVAIQDEHTNIIKIVLNDSILYEKIDAANSDYDITAAHPIHSYSIDDLYCFAQEVPIKDLAFISEAWKMNMLLFEAGLNSSKTPILHYLYQQNGNTVFSNRELETAQLICSGAIEARVLGIDYPAMSITGSGAHGIIASLPLYAVCKIRQLSQEMLLRATALSFLITRYIKEYSGRLSALCGCAIAAGTGMACGMAYLGGASSKQLTDVINNMACGITGMICDGGNHGCAIKSIVAVDAAFRASNLALHNVSIPKVHGINGMTGEETMKNIGLIAVPGMVGTEKTILDIFLTKN